MHKVQGLSLAKIVVIFQLLKQRQFNYGQIYVALSRVTTLEGLHILGPFTEDSIRANPFALVEYSRMRTESILSEEFAEDTHQESLIVTLLNVRSLNKHIIDLALDERLTKSDIICLTETQLIPNSDIQEIATLQGFEVVYNNNQDRFQSIAVCTKVNAHIISHTKLTGASFITVLKPSFDNKIIKLLLLYKKHVLPLNSFCYWLQGFVTNNSVDTILGDFNVNGFNENIRLSQILSRYDQLVNTSTHISGSFLDHFYIRQEFPKPVTSDVISIYFSDHNAIKLKLF